MISSMYFSACVPNLAIALLIRQKITNGKLKISMSLIKRLTPYATCFDVKFKYGSINNATISTNMKIKDLE